MRAICAIQKTPEEYASWKAVICCNDCEERSFVDYHLVAHECVHCRGYNTSIVDIIKDFKKEEIKESTADTTADTTEESTKESSEESTADTTEDTTVDTSSIGITDDTELDTDCDSIDLTEELLGISLDVDCIDI